MCKTESLLFDNNNACASSNSVHDIPPLHLPHFAATAAHSLFVMF
jgi:hypothetical protein